MATPRTKLVTVTHTLEVPCAPSEDELYFDDGMRMESWRHVLQMMLLIETLRRAWTHRPDVFVGGNMFVYYSPDQVFTEDFRGPDVFVALGATPRERNAWIVWVEGKGPDVVIELLSPSTARFDKHEKKQIYQDKLRAPEYFWYDPATGELAGFALRDGVYQPLEPDAGDRVSSPVLGLTLVRWQGSFRGEDALWLRWADADGTLLPTDTEVAVQQRQEADQARLRIGELEARLARYERPPDEPPSPAR